MSRIRQAPARLAERPRRTQRAKKEKAIVGGRSRAKKKDTDSEQHTGSTTNNKQPKTGEVNPELFKALKSLEMLAANPKKD